jgi:hypothetical protein
MTVLNDPRFWSSDRGERLRYVLAALAAGIERTAIFAYPSEDGHPPVKNWNEGKWDTAYDPVSVILARAKHVNIAF